MGLYLKLTFVGVFAYTALFANTKRLNYIETYKYIAIQEMERTGIPASIKLAQGLLESGAGASTLAKTANNHFGIKCGGRWDGEVVYRKDDDYDKNGNLKKSCFRKYKSAAQSFEAHSAFLLRNKRYNSLFELKMTNYKGWANGLRKAGYATNPSYARLLISIIERYELYQYDKMTTRDFDNFDAIMAKLEKESQMEVIVENTTIAKPVAKPKPAKKRIIKPVISSVNAVKMTQAIGNESIADIARRTNTPANAIVRFNENINSFDSKPEAGERIFLQPKRNAFRATQRTHMVAEGESMYDIAQLYGLRLKKLYERNLMQQAQQAATGEVIYLRGRRAKAPKLRLLNEREQAQAASLPDDLTLMDEYGDEYLDWEMASASVDVPKVTHQPSRTQARPNRTTRPSPQPLVKETTPAPVASTNIAVASTDKPKEKPVLKQMQERPEPLMRPAMKTDNYPTAPIPKLPNQEERKNDIAPTRYYKVGKGDTLYRIAKTHAISVHELKDWNGLNSNTIQIGQVLKVS